MTERDHKAGDAERWQRLWRLLAPHHERAVLTARRLSRDTLEGDDLYQEAVVRAYRKLDGLREEAKFRSWFYAVLLSLHRTRTRWSFWRRFVALEPLLQVEREPGAVDANAFEEEAVQLARIRQALAALPTEQRQAVVLHDLDGFTMEEIATMTGVTVSAVKSRTSRGRQRLRRFYERLGFGAASAASGVKTSQAQMTMVPREVRTAAGPSRPGGSR